MARSGSTWWWLGALLLCAPWLAACNGEEQTGAAGGSGAASSTHTGGSAGQGGVATGGSSSGGAPSCSTPDWPGAPYAPSPVICSLAWGATVYRDATDSDTWPITWGDDDAQYTAYADGTGFAPGAPSKLSLGLARVSGPPESFVGENIPSPSGEHSGDGSAGKKASGMLMVDGVLYMWMRNAVTGGTECQLASSNDHAQSWSEASWTLAELGYCTFINFGQDYAGARDDYVYTVSHDDPSAYEIADHMVLARVHRDHILERASYEFFVQVGAGNQPEWSAAIGDRGPVFTHTGGCARSGLSFNAALGRYLWWQQLPEAGVDTRFEGGFGIYDGPEPWGPWTTVYFVEQWDEGPGETGSFPTKWMSADGRSAWLVHSGDDAFSVRKATLTLAGDR